MMTYAWSYSHGFGDNDVIVVVGGDSDYSRCFSSRVVMVVVYSGDGSNSTAVP